MFRKTLTPLVKISRNFSTSVEVGKTVGFIGLGNMGAFMAKNLAKKGHNLVVLDLSQDAIQNVKNFAEENGRQVAQVQTPAEMAAMVDVIVTMLPSSPHVKEVYTGANGILSALKGRTAEGKGELLLIDSSTIAPPVAAEVAEAVKSCNDGKATMIDAPVSGGVGGAEAGTLTFMCGGEVVDFDASVPYLEKMGKNIVHCGPNSTGQVAKVCNNLILGITMTGVSEAYNLGVKLGADPHQLAKIVNTSSGRCWSSDTYNPVPDVMPNVPSSRGYTGGFGVDLMLKDINLAIESAEKVGASLPLGTKSAELYKTISEQGHGKKDFAYMYQHFSKDQK